MRRANQTSYKVRHGQSRNRTWTSWWKMKERCSDSNCNRYHRYGGRGIKVCDKWLVFEGFYEDMGERPENTSLDRIDVNGNYELSNCRWATKKEQARNTCKNIVFDGLCLSEWAEKLNVNYKNFYYHYKKHGFDNAVSWASNWHNLTPDISDGEL